MCAVQSSFVDGDFETFFFLCKLRTDTIVYWKLFLNFLVNRRNNMLKCKIVLLCVTKHQAFFFKKNWCWFEEVANLFQLEPWQNLALGLADILLLQVQQSPQHPSKLVLPSAWCMMTTRMIAGLLGTVVELILTSSYVVDQLLKTEYYRMIIRIVLNILLTAYIYVDR